MATRNPLAAIAFSCAEMKSRIVPLGELLTTVEDDMVREQAILFLNAATSPWAI
jgi:HEAT repeat protein